MMKASNALFAMLAIVMLVLCLLSVQYAPLKSVNGAVTYMNAQAVVNKVVRIMAQSAVQVVTKASAMIVRMRTLIFALSATNTTAILMTAMIECIDVVDLLTLLKSFNHRLHHHGSFQRIP